MSDYKASRSLTILLVAACAACAHAHDPWRGSPPRMPVTTVAIRNNGPVDVSFFVVNAVGARAHLGTIMRASRRDLVIPARLLTRWGVQLMVQPIGGGPALVMSCPEIWPGSTLRVVLEDDPVASSCSMR